METFVCLYAQEHPNFRIAELKSILDLLGVTGMIDEENHTLEKPFLSIQLSGTDDAKKILERSVLLRYIIKLWGDGSSTLNMLKTYPDILRNAQEFADDMTSSFCYKIEAFNKKLSMDDKRAWIEDLESKDLDFGKVDLRNPTHTMHLLLDYGDDKTSKTLTHIYLGELVGYGQRQLIQQYSLKTRYFIGNTSMDPQLSFIMANQGKVQRGSIVFDPFVGTGSIITCCAHFGAMTAGSDIDYSIVYGRGRPSRAGQTGWRARDEIIRTNYQNYGLCSQYLDIMTADIAKLPFHRKEIFDAIITDPPYGIREGGRKQSLSKTGVTPESGVDNFPAIEKQGLSGVILSLIECAAKYLVTGGRLVFWLPVYRPSYTDKIIPTHPLLKLVANNEQLLTRKISRRLITMEKTSSFKPGVDTEMEAQAKLPDIYCDLHDDFRSKYFGVGNEN